MLLVIDVGNTSLHWGVFENDVLRKTGRILTATFLKTNRTARSIWKPFLSGNVLVSSVVPSADPMLRKLFPQAEFVTASNIALIKVRVTHPKQVGADRLVNAVAAWTLYGGASVIVDFGTATTFCAVTKKGEYIGGAIVPGIDLARIALHEHTAKLPLVPFAKPQKVIGTDTVSAIQSGLFFGYTSLVEGMLARFQKQLGSAPKIIFTGGYAPLIRKGLPSKKIIVDELLTLKGLSIIAVS